MKNRLNCISKMLVRRRVIYTIVWLLVCEGWGRAVYIFVGLFALIKANIVEKENIVAVVD